MRFQRRASHPGRRPEPVSDRPVQLEGYIARMYEQTAKNVEKPSAPEDDEG